MSVINIHHQDCMEAMKEMPDKAYQLCICDSPYGIGEASGREASRNQSHGRAQTPVKYAIKAWDKQPPPTAYFSELRRVSVNQIIWGGNFFIDHLSSTSCMIVWDKDNSGDFADAELAWTSFKTATRIFKYRWNGMLQQDMKHKEHRIHPCQKPTALYEYLLKNYAHPGDKILDTHGGSCSLAIAADIMGYSADIYEIDADYFQAATERFIRHKNQGVLEL